MKRTILTLSILAAAAAAAGFVRADSFYVGNSFYSSKPTSPLKINDAVVIEIVENASSQNNAKYEEDREWKLEWALEQLSYYKYNKTTKALDTKQLPVTFPSNLKGGNKYEIDNENKQTIRDIVQDEIMAEIVDIRPNGRLVISARKDLTVDSHRKILTVTGEVPPDMMVGNRVKSTNVLNLCVQWRTEGSVGRATRKGWFLQFLEWLWPF